MSPIDAKKIMLAHSEAKVQFFKTYLERYLRILYLAPNIEEINIFDVFCGTGIYDNEKKGSPIVAFDSIKHLREEHGYSKRINLTVNDSEGSKVASVQTYIDTNNNGDCNVNYNVESADVMFSKILDAIAHQNLNSRNLIFIDPYGYKEIKKSTLADLLRNDRTEIILFLPISPMQRFTAHAVESDEKPYEPLREFVRSFFDPDHPIRKQTVSATKYIGYLKDALRFSNYYTTSYYIERDESNYYALFFISPHIYGFEKILEVKWQLDEEGGRGFRRAKPPGLFDDQAKEINRIDNYAKLEEILNDYLKSPKNNREVYEIILRNEFLPKHAVEVFREWQQEPNFEVVDFRTGEKVRKGTFHLNWESYRDANPKVRFTLK